MKHYTLPTPNRAAAPEGGYDLSPGSCAFVPAGTVFSLRTAEEEDAAAPQGKGGKRQKQGKKQKPRGGPGFAGAAAAAEAEAEERGEASLVLLVTLAPQPTVDKAVGNAVALAKASRGFTL